MTQQHSPEPCRVRASVVRYGLYRFDVVRAEIVIGKFKSNIEADRVATCVNACQGISNEDIEAGIIVANKKDDSLSNSPYLSGDSCMLSQGE